MRQLLQEQHMKNSFSICLDSEQHKLYVTGKDKKNVDHVFIYDYIYLCEGKLLTEKITSFELTVTN